jgi:cobalamin biosynthesis Mg chelatase CobN
MKWRTVRDDLGLADYTFGRRITAKIKELDEYEKETLPGLKERLEDPEEEDNEEQIQADIETVETAIKDLNKQLCGDMRRAHAVKDKKQVITGNLKNQASGSDDQTQGANEPVLDAQGNASHTASPGTATATAAPTAPKNNTPGPESSNNSKPNGKAAAPPAQQQPVATGKKKSKAGWIVFFSLVAAGLGFGVGRVTKK